MIDAAYQAHQDEFNRTRDMAKADDAFMDYLRKKSDELKEQGEPELDLAEFGDNDFINSLSDRGYEKYRKKREAKNKNEQDAADMSYQEITSKLDKLRGQMADSSPIRRRSFQSEIAELEKKMEILLSLNEKKPVDKFGYLNN